MNSNQPQQPSSIQDQALKLLESLPPEDQLKILDYIQSLYNENEQE